MTAATSLEALLDEVETGGLDARSPAATALRRRLEGAVLALRVQAPRSGSAGPGP